MTNQGHFESAAYMVRNLLTGDEEETRIGEGYLSELPESLAIGARYLTSKEGGYDYDGAIMVYVRWHLHQVVSAWYMWKAEHTNMFHTACLSVLESMGVEKPDEEDLKWVAQWEEEAQRILGRQS